MLILTATELGHSFGAADLFEGIYLQVDRRDRVGLVGPNGSGKTTLLLNLAGLLEPTKGQVQLQDGVTLGYLRQEAVLTFAGQENTVYEEMQSVYAALREMERELRGMESAMAKGEAEASLFERYGDLQAEYETAGGYHYDIDIQRVLTGLGFPEAEWQTPLSHLSGGQKTRVLLGRLLLEKPDLLILDEPTNHLDMPAVEWLERMLRNWAGALIIVSHDRYFLDAIVNRVWDLDQGSLESYRGNYSSFVQQRQAAWDREMTLFQAEKERLEKELAFVRKHIAGGKTDIAKGKLKRLTRDIVLLEEVGVTGREGKSWLEIGGRVRTFSANQAARRLRDLKPPAARPPPLAIRLQAEQRSARSVARAKELLIGFAERPLFVTDPIQVDRQDCVALIGPNGSGKSTMLKALMGELSPLRGTIKFGDGVQAGYFAQAHEQLNDRNRVLDELLAHKAMSPEDGRNYLAQYLFVGDDVFKQISDLSGGERARLALALLAADGANLLLLDEPTNHLDIPSQEILEAVLAQFEGTIILVSHDRYLVNRLANQIWEIEEGRMVVFAGSYDDYLRFRAGEVEEEAEPTTKVETLEWLADYTPPPISKREKRDAAHRWYAISNAIEDAEFRLQFLVLEEEKAAAMGEEARTAELSQEIAVVQMELDDLNEELERLVG